MSMYMKMKTKQRYLDGVFNTMQKITLLEFGPTSFSILPREALGYIAFDVMIPKKERENVLFCFILILMFFFVLETWFLSRIQCSKIYKNSKLWDREHPQRLRINFFYSTGTDLKLNMQEIFFKKNFPCFQNTMLKQGGMSTKSALSSPFIVLFIQNVYITYS